MISINSTLFELELQQRNRELERKAERRRRLDEMVHYGVRSPKNQGRLRRIFGGGDAHPGDIS